MSIDRARRISSNAMWRDQRRFYNFDYPAIWREFEQKNGPVLEQEEDVELLKQYVGESNAPTRAIEGNGYLSWAQRTLYARLTVLTRLGLNWISELPDDSSLPKGFEFCLEDEDLVLDRELEKWLKEQRYKDPEIAAMFPQE